MVTDFEVNVGDTVEIEAQGCFRRVEVEYVCKDGPHWLIEGKDGRYGPVYWKSRSDGGRIVSVTPNK